MKAPKGNEDDVMDLPVYRHDAGTIYAVKLSAEEIERVQETGVVWVNIASHSMPPIAVSGHAFHTWGGADPQVDLSPLTMRGKRFDG